MNPREVAVRTRRHWARRAAPLLTAGLLLLAAGCGRRLPQDALDPQGPYARKTDNLWNLVLPIAAVVFVLVEGLIVYIALRFRARSADERPVQVHGNARAELTWTIIPAAVLAVVGFLTVGTLFDLSRTPAGADVVNVEVIGHQWWWEYQYPAEKITTANELHIPAGRPVALVMTSVDVIHSFWPPKLAGKIDTVPGRFNKLTIQADRPGVFYGQCAEYCGTSHANMRLRVVAHSPSDWADWLRTNKRTQPAIEAPSQPAGGAATGAAGGTPEGGATSDLSNGPTTTTSTTTALPAGFDAQAAKGYELFNGSAGCAGCHSVNGTPAAGQIGPNLTHLYQRDVFAGSIFSLNDKNLRLWLRNPQAAKPGAKMIIRHLTEEEIDQLIAYLHTLK